jgi:hypothetical protein
MELQLWIRLRLRLRPRCRPRLRPRPLQAQAQAQAARAELEAYVKPQLLDRDIDRRHRSFLSAVLGEDVGHVRSHTTRTLLPIHDRWVPKYVNWCCVIVCTFIYSFVVTNKLRYLFQTMSCRTPACSVVSPGGQPTQHNSSKGSHDTLPIRLLPP